MWHWLSAPEYQGARFAVTHLVALVYLIGFVSFLRQFPGLLGSDGLTPVARFVERVPFRRAPSLFHFRSSDRWLAGVGWAGVVVSLLAQVADLAPVWAWLLLWALLWVLYSSIVNVGQVWYGFGWESLLLETGFLVIFLGPAHVAPPVVVVWLLCWLLFRVEFGAGLIKLRGDSCWRDLTALHYHHETQPVPGPLSRFFHWLPRPLHKVEVVANHGTQLVVPFLLFFPQPVATVAALIIIATQLWLMLSGNFAWLNLLTTTLAFAAISTSPVTLPDPPGWFAVLVLAVTALFVVLAYWPVRNMLGKSQVMNRSFNRLHLGNTYGAFGSITRVRYEVVVQGANDPDGPWREYEFKVKPGDPARRPPQVAPYHLRLDWLMWFVAINPSYGSTWLPRFLRALLRNEPQVLALLRHNPFPDAPPKLVKADLYRYRFTTRRELRETGNYWVRSWASDLVPPLTLDDLAGRG
ncbi:lipase maturation factor family protein [Saccharopolyspora rhizosphaerae]|uniref:Lipase maturation factor family protein n=1 Tax=Saccharopolyspora rhizosphaerae TaxID=2492662 RepID=A0A426JYG7_9PSEU|nr:lipase maturation factor family protein [Saccharopolyspora rhizosphaerae]RRO18255.1 lipase maturation factor family protein [Saccharopolyspora rhizosphaerae]